MVGWQPQKVQLPDDLSKALLVALRAAASKGLSRAGVSDDETAEVRAARTGTGATRSCEREYVAGEDVQYWSSTNQEWRKACVLSTVRDARGNIRYSLDIKSKVEASQLRALSESRNAPPESSDAKGAPGTANKTRSTNDSVERVQNTNGDPSHGYAVGASVQCWNLEHKRWQDGTISRQYEHSGITVYDVACKQSVLRMLPASRLRLSSLQVGDSVEYWSKTAKIWLQATVIKLILSKQVADLDIKKGAPLANVRKADAAPKKGAPASGGASEEAAAQDKAKDAAAGVRADEEEDEEDLEDELDLDPDWEDQMWEALQAEDEGAGSSDEEQKASPRRRAKDDSKPRSRTGAARSRSRSTRTNSQSPLRRRPVPAMYTASKGAGPPKGKGKGKKNPPRRGEYIGKGAWTGRGAQPRYREGAQDGRYGHSSRWRDERRW